MRQLCQRVVVVLWSALAMQVLTAQAPAYDAFMQQTVQERIHVFNLLSPEERAELVRTHSTRWLTANSARLSAEQIAVMRENIAFVKADAYRPETRDAFVAQAKDLERRTAALFSREDMQQALTIYADYVPARVP